MTVKDIVKGQQACFLQDKDNCDYCKGCPFRDIEEVSNCQKLLAQATIDKLNELVELVDDKVNHHYYDTLEQYQQINNELQDKLDQIESIITNNYNVD